jgi:hypothetical protein
VKHETKPNTFCGPGYLSRYSDSLRSGDRIPVGGEIFRTRPDRTWSPPSLLYNGYRGFPGGIEWPGRDAHHPPHLAPEVKESVELYFYSTSEPSWPVTGGNLYLYLFILNRHIAPIDVKATDLLVQCGGQNDGKHCPKTFLP